MRGSPKDDGVILEAIALQNRGHHLQAAVLLQRAGNQVRLPSEKDELWKAAERAHQIANSD